VRKLVAALSAACAFALALAAYGDAAAGASAYGDAAAGAGFSASLSAGEMVPAVKASGNGSFSATLKGYLLSFKLSFSHLSGPAVGASLGFGPKGKAGHLTIPLCAPCKSPVTTGVGVDKSLITALRQHLLFVVVRTQKHPNGEIRGQIQ